VEPPADGQRPGGEEFPAFRAGADAVDGRQLHGQFRGLLALPDAE
jgi:hypothetical protein